MKSFNMMRILSSIRTFILIRPHFQWPARPKVNMPGKMMEMNLGSRLVLYVSFPDNPRLPGKVGPTLSHNLFLIYRKFGEKHHVTHYINQMKIVQWSNARQDERGFSTGFCHVWSQFSSSFANELAGHAMKLICSLKNSPKEWESVCDLHLHFHE